MKDLINQHLESGRFLDFDQNAKMQKYNLNSPGYHHLQTLRHIIIRSLSLLYGILIKAQQNNSSPKQDRFKKITHMASTCLEDHIQRGRIKSQTANCDKFWLFLVKNGNL